MTDLEHAREQGIAPWDLEVQQLEDFHVMVFQDRFPVAQGHLLFVPKYNADSVIKDCFELALAHGRELIATGACEAFNVGLNIGSAAGQTVMYPHVHLIPRRNGDTPDPVGGVRGVIPGQANYKKDTYKNPN